MIPVRYPVTPIKIGVTLLTIGLLMAMLLARNPILTAFLCFSSLITAMIHFNIFEDTADTQPLNRIDLILQVAFVVLSIGKVIVVGGH